MIGDADTYPINIVEVVRPTRYSKASPKDRQIMVTQGPTQNIEELSFASSPPGVAKTQVFNLRCHVMPSEREATSVDSILTSFAADVLKAVCTPTNSWHTFGGYAINASFGDFQPFVSDGGIDGINLPLNIIYRTAENDPYTQR
jgi:hypothetical protein